MKHRLDQIWMMLGSEMSRHFIGLVEFVGANPARILFSNIHSDDMKQGLPPPQDVDEAAQFIFAQRTPHQFTINAGPFARY
jgi:hypothetical protein